MKNYFLLLILFSKIFASIQQTDSCLSTIDYETSKFFSQGKNIFNYTFDSKNFNNHLYSVSGVLASFILDKSVHKLNLKTKYPSLEPATKFFKNFGEITIVTSASIGFYFFGSYYQNELLKSYGRDLFTGLFYAGSITTIIKFVTGRSRPYVNEGPYKFRYFQTKNDLTSFPSGHTTVAFTLATITANEFNNPTITTLAYTTAFGTAIERIYSNNHWFSDVVTAGIIGYTVGKIITNKKNPNNSLQIYPDFYNNRLNIVYNF